MLLISADIKSIENQLSALSAAKTVQRAAAESRFSTLHSSESVELILDQGHVPRGNELADVRKNLLSSYHEVFVPKTEIGLNMNCTPSSKEKVSCQSREIPNSQLASGAPQPRTAEMNDDFSAISSYVDRSGHDDVPVDEQCSEIVRSIKGGSSDGEAEASAFIKSEQEGQTELDLSR